MTPEQCVCDGFFPEIVAGLQTSRYSADGRFRRSHLLCCDKLYLGKRKG